MGILEHFPFPRFREHQKEFLEKIYSSFIQGKEFVILEAPTGFGKSPLAVALGKCFASSHILTSTKQLQGQYLREFPKSVRTAKGRANFLCLQNELSANLGMCRSQTDYVCYYRPSTNGEGEYAATSSRRGELFWQTDTFCPYWEQKTAALNAEIALHNYVYFLLESNYVGDFGPRTLMVCDEAHNIEKEIMGYMALNISQRTLDRFDIGVQVRCVDEDMGICKRFLESLAGKLVSAKLKAKSPNDLETLENLEARVKKLGSLLKEEPENWVVIKGPDGERLEFKPLKISQYSQELLFNKANQKLLMSATILDKDLFCDYTGISSAEYLQVPCVIPASHRRFHLRYAGNMSMKGREVTLPKLIKEVDKICKEHSDHKGIIHTVSYQNAEGIFENCSPETKRRLLYPRNSGEIKAILQKHETSKEPTVLISPSMKEGVDLVEDLSRFQIIVKVPFPDLGDILVKKRMDLDTKWYYWLTALSLIQTAGRSIRAADDWAETYMLDSAFDTLKNSRLIPGWFKESYRE